MVEGRAAFTWTGAGAWFSFYFKSELGNSLQKTDQEKKIMKIFCWLHLWLLLTAIPTTQTSAPERESNRH